MKSELEGLKMAMAAAKGGTRADNIKFETEDECLAYCKRLVTLKPGDEVLTKAEGEEARRGMFTGSTDGGGRAGVLFWEEDGQVHFGKFTWGCIRLPG